MAVGRFGFFDGRVASALGFVKPVAFVEPSAFVGAALLGESADPAICSSVAARLPARDCASFERRGRVFFLLCPAFADPDALGTDSVY